MRFLILRNLATARTKALLFLFLLTLSADSVFAAQVAATPAPEIHSSSARERLARITATPNPAPAGRGQGTTIIRWQTGDGSPGEVRVAVAGEPEKLFARGTQGSQAAEWITINSTCEFRLYSETNPNALLASVEVTGSTEMPGALDTISIILKDFSLTRSICFGFLLLLFAGIYYASRVGNKRLVESLSVAVALFAIVFALLPVLLIKPRPLAEQPFPDAHELSDAARQLASGNGYVTYTYHNERHPPRSPPGFPLLLAPFAAFGGEFPASVQLGAKFFAAVYVLCVVFAAWSVGGWLTAAFVATLIGVSPFARIAATLVMSDAFAAGLTALFIPLLHRPSMRRVALAGVLAGALIAVRLPMVLVPAALFVVLPSWSFRRQLFFFAAPFALAHALYNWMTFGSPFRTGYSYGLPGLKNFAWSYAVTFLPHRDGPWITPDALDGLLLQWMCPCQLGGPQASLPSALFYPAILLGLFWVFAPPFVTLLGLVCVWTRRREATAKFTLCLTCLSLMLFTFYFAQGTRFMAAPVTLLIIFAAVGITQFIERAAAIRTFSDVKNST